MRGELITIIIPTFNREKFITETLDSVLNQSYENWECIVVDDGSSDNTLKIVESYNKKDNRFHIFKRNIEPKGANTCRNIGINNATGKYIIFLDSDDILKPFCIQKRVAEFELNNEFDFLVFPTLVIKDGKEYKIYNKTYESYLSAFIIHEVPWTIMGSIWKREYLKSIDGFDQNFERLQDVELNIRALSLGAKFKFFDKSEPDNIYRNSSFNFNQKSIEKILGAANKLITKYRSEFNSLQITKYNDSIDTLYLNFLKRYALYYYKSPIISEFVNYDIQLTSSFRNIFILGIQRWLYNKNLIKIYPFKITSFFLWRLFYRK